MNEEIMFKLLVFGARTRWCEDHTGLWFEIVRDLGDQKLGYKNRYPAREPRNMRGYIAHEVDTWKRFVNGVQRKMEQGQ